MASLALRRMVSLGLSRALRADFVLLLLTVMRISLAVRLLSCEALAVEEEDTVVMFADLAAAGVPATDDHVEVLAGDCSCCCFCFWIDAFCCACCALMSVWSCWKACQSWF